MTIRWVPSLCLLLLLLPAASQAQWQVGLRGGVVRNQVPMDFSDRVFYESTWENQASFGVVALYNLVPNLELETGVTYAIKRHLITRASAPSDPVLSYRGTFDRLDRHYLEVPLGLRLAAGNWNWLNGTWSVLLNGGGYGGYWVLGQRRSRMRSLTGSPWEEDNLADLPAAGTVLIEGEYQFDDDYGPDGVRDNRWEFGVYGGVGLQYRHARFGALWIETRYQQALTDLKQFQGDTPATNQDRRNRSVRFDIGYAIPLSLLF